MGYDETEKDLQFSNVGKVPASECGAKSISFEKTSGLLLAMQRLRTAYQFAGQCKVSCWEFAIEIDQLQLTGITAEELRWLIATQMIEHAEESTIHGQPKRSFESRNGLHLSSSSCFVISKKGIESWPPQNAPRTIDMKPGEQPHSQIHAPLWDSVRHELRLGSILVKKFKWRAANQEAILAAFQEDGWPAHIYDPLTPQAEINPKRRLSDAIKCLNRKQACPKIRFCGDGTGEGVLWEVR